MHNSGNEQDGELWDTIQDPNAQDYYSSYLQNPLKTFIQTPTFLSIVESKRFETVLDASCGDGSYSRVLFHSGVTFKLCAIDTNVEQVVQETTADEQEFIEIIKLDDMLQIDTNRTFDCVCGTAGSRYLLNRAPNIEYLRQLVTIMSKICNDMFIGYVYNPFLRTGNKKFMAEEQVLLEWHGDEQLYDGSQLDITIGTENFTCHWYSDITIARLCTENGFSRFEWVKPTLYAAALEDEKKEYSFIIETPPFFAFVAYKH
jgi:hypothetical protein